ncbi:MAG: DUF1501 domain-containing protein [Chloroflexi bacterium]|nr:DUF1501 domain-containing protein [Chloroflexota bacterium]
MRMEGINRLSRREFSRRGLLFGVGEQAAASGYAAVPDVLARAVHAQRSAGVTNDKVIVMVQLAGGNDGLGTVIPLGDARFRDLRPSLGAVAAKALPLTKEWGLNENLAGIKKLYDAGKVAVVQGIGYPEPSFSHFDSIRVWETGDPTRRELDGWLGKVVAKNYDSAGHPLVGTACGNDSIPGMFRDLDAQITVIDDKETFKFQGTAAVEDVMGALYTRTPGIYGALFDTSMRSARDTLAQLRTSNAKYVPKANYSDSERLVFSSKNKLAAAFSLAAQLIVTGTGVKVLHMTLGGFDTHFTQANRQDLLLGYLDKAVAAFHQDLAAYGMSDRVLVATWSEFGRRPRENASAGTDHGTASPVFLIGDPVKGGLYGEAPNLGRIGTDGNLSYGVDFRSVYQTILDDHLKVPSREVFSTTFDRIPFLKAG